MQMKMIKMISTTRSKQPSYQNETHVNWWLKCQSRYRQEGERKRNGAKRNRRNEWKWWTFCRLLCCQQPCDRRDTFSTQNLSHSYMGLSLRDEGLHYKTFETRVELIKHLTTTCLSPKYNTAWELTRDSIIKSCENTVSYLKLNRKKWMSEETW